MQSRSLLQLPPTCKADILFHRSFLALRTRTIQFTVLLLIQAVTFISLAIYTFIQKPNSDPMITNTLILAAVATFYGFLVRLSQVKNIYGNPRLYVTIAQATNHAVAGQGLTGLGSLEECTSSIIFSAESMLRQPDLGQDAKKILLRITRISIKSIIQKSIRWVRRGQYTFSLLSIAVIIYAIVTMATIPMDTYLIVILSVYAAIVFFNQLFVILVLIVVALFPLLCLGLCLYCCCCSKRGDGNIIDIPITDATMTDIMNAGGNCPICFQGIAISEKIYVLRCSEKHIFHSDCLNHWAKVKHTCPNCRADIPMRNSPFQPAAI